MSMTLATLAKGTLSSPLTNMTFSARVLKISVRRPCKPSQVVSSWLIFKPGFSPAPRSINCTTIVRSGVLFFGAFGGGGWGTSASKPFGVSGVITMKMISNTSKTSISGVTFMFAFWPPLGPTAILINRSPIYDRVLLPARRRRGARRRGKGSGLFLIRQKTELVHAGGAYIVDDFDHPAELRPHIGLEKDPLVGPVRQLILDLLRQVLWLDEIVPEEDLVIASDGNLERVFLVG